MKPKIEPIAIVSKRELFALVALFGMISSGGEKENKVKAAVEYADILIDELEKDED